LIHFPHTAQGTAVGVVHNTSALTHAIGKLPLVAVAVRLRELAGELSCDFERLKPRAEDWNAMLKEGAIA